MATTLRRVGKAPDQVRGQTGALGDRLRAWRRAAGLTQEELAERAGLTVHAVSALERGARTRPHPHTVRSLARALQLSGADSDLLRASATQGTADSPPARPAPVRSVLAPGRLVGRERELATLSGMLRNPETRLLTLTGTGGVGKTRLATAVLDAAGAEFPDGTTFVSFAAVTDPALVLPTLGRALGLPGGDGATAAEAIAAHLRPLRHLLVVDNLEHLIEAGADLVDLLASCSRLTVLVTSRACLRVRAEIEYPVQPLTLPTSTNPDPSALAASPAGALFEARARTVVSAFEITERNAPAVAGICRQLAGIPLALELAAARLRYLAPDDLLERLDDALAREGLRDLPARQRTMRAAIDWSYRLLDPPAQTLFRRVATFTGGFTLEAAEAVGAGPPLDPSEVLGALEGLSEQSLLVSSAEGDRTRFGLLEPIAQYARDLLVHSGEATEVHARHVRYFDALTERAKPEYQGPQQLTWLARMDAETANTAAAIQRALAAGQATTAARMCAALSRFWWLRGHLLLGRRLTDAALRYDISDPAVHVETLVAAATLALGLGDLPSAREQWQEALDASRAHGDLAGEANALAGLGVAALTDEDLDTAEERLTAALGVAAAAGPVADWTAALDCIWLGTVRKLRGDLPAAAKQVGRGLATARRLGDRLSSCIALYNLAQVALAADEAAVARGHLLEAVDLALQMRDTANLAFLLDALAVIDGVLGRPERFATLLGAARTMRELAGGEVYSYYRPQTADGEREKRRAGAALGEHSFDAAVQHGQQLKFEQAVQYALAQI